MICDKNFSPTNYCFSSRCAKSDSHRWDHVCNSRWCWTIRDSVSVLWEIARVCMENCGNYGKPSWKPVRFAIPVERYTVSDELLSSKSLFETISTLQLLVVKNWSSFSFHDFKGNLEARKSSTSSKTVSRPSLTESKSYNESCTASLNSKGLRRHQIIKIV